MVGLLVARRVIGDAQLAAEHPFPLRPKFTIFKLVPSWSGGW
jgi:hypothetical protein